MNKQEIKEIYEEIDTIQKIRISSIILIILASFAVGGYIGENKILLPDFYKQIDDIAHNHHILTDNNNNYYYITPYQEDIIHTNNSTDQQRTNP